MSEEVLTENPSQPQASARSEAMSHFATASIAIFLHCMVEVPEPSVWYDGIPIWLVKSYKVVIGVLGILLFTRAILEYLRHIALEVVEKLKS